MKDAAVMVMNIVLIDYENVQPTDLNRLQGGSFLVRLFVGPKQSCLSIKTVRDLQPLGTNVEYVTVDKAGKNALDFQLACYLGQLTAAYPTACFHILSADTGFDGLIQHLQGRKFRIERAASLAKLSCFQNPAAPPQPLEKTPVERIVAALKGIAKEKRPATRKSLRNAIQSWTGNALPVEELDRLVTSLSYRGLVRFEGQKALY